MTTRNTHIFDPGIWFVTFTNYNWIPLFGLTDDYDVVYKWFESFRAKGNEITGYVIMPNHLHVLLVYRDTTSSLNTLIGNGKRFMAYEIINRLEQKNEVGLLERLKKGVNEKERTKKQLHKVFEPSFDCKKCEGFDFLTQKLDYMHANPVSGKWELVKESIDYLHSSNNFYETGKNGIYKITHYMDLAETADW